VNKLKKLAIRIGEISDEITDLKSKREINLEKCAGSEDEEFAIKDPAAYNGSEPFNNCLFNAYEWVKADREEGLTSSFHDVIINYGCKNCVGAYKAKRKIGLLRQERGRLVGNISTIGKSLRSES
jgi:hypothetical protein